MYNKKKTSLIYFKRWSRKKFSVFASLHKLIKICIVTFTCTLVQERYLQVYAQSDSLMTSEDEISLDEIEITDNPIMPWSGFSSTNAVIGKKEIEAFPAEEISDILKPIPGIDIRQRGNEGVQTDISINGGSFDQVLILLNGVNITDPQTGHYNLEIPLDLSQIQKIEILKGSGARILGSNAFSGAINLITETGNNEKKTNLKFQINKGNYGYIKGLASISINKSKWSTLLSGSVTKSDGYIENTDFKTSNFYLNSSVKNIFNGRLIFQAGFQKKDFGANSFYSFAYPRQFESTETLFSSLSWSKASDFSKLNISIHDRLHHDRFELFRNMLNTPNWYSNHNYHLTDVKSLNIKYDIFSKVSNTTIGLEVKNEHIYSNVLGLAMVMRKSDPFDINGFFIKEKGRTNASLYANQGLTLNSIDISAGLNGNLNSDYGTYWHGGADVTYHLSKGFKTWIALNRSLRLPTFTDLYYTAATHKGNQDIKPEIALNIENGWSYKSNKLNLNATFWFRNGRNIIDWVKNPDSLKWESQNLTMVNATGINLSTEIKLNSRHFKTLELYYSYQHLDKNAEGYDSKYALDYLRNKAGVSLGFDIFEKNNFGLLSGKISYCWYDRSGTWTDYYDKQLKSFTPYNLCDLRLLWKKNIFSLHLDINNILNTQYQDYGGLPLPGTEIKAGITINY
jgi:iron complex outermembrane receptor protein